MRKLIFSLILILAGVIAYMYFFGKGEDKQKADEIVAETKELARSVGDFIKRQKDKYDNGELDKIFDKIGHAIDKLKSKKSNNQDEVTQDLKDLEKELKQIDPEKLNDENRERLKKLLNDLEQELEKTEWMG